MKAAQEEAVFEYDETDSYNPNDSTRHMFIDELNAQEAILKQEKALEKARKKLETIRVARYHKQQKEEEENDSVTQNEA